MSTIRSASDAVRRLSLTGQRGIILALVLGFVAAAVLGARAQAPTDIGRAPTLTIERYPEDWTHLADPGRRTGRWTERLKYIPLSADGSRYLTTGVEVRSRYEHYGNANWGAAPDDGYVWHRFMPYADLHLGNLRLFAQPIVSAISGVRRPRRPVDTTGADLLQAFAEVEFNVADTASLRLSAGRKLVSLGAGRLVDTRYGPGVPQAFDGFDAILTGASRQLTALYFRPAENSLDDFDDRTSNQKALWGLYGTQWLSENQLTGFDLFYLGLRDRKAVYDQGAGKEVVHTFGTRIYGDTGSWYWNLEGGVQLGTFAGHRRAAWGAGAEFGHRFREAPMRPDLRLSADVISGDDDPTDPELGTLNPYFPRGKYFTSQSPIGPRNLVHIRPSITLHPFQNVEVALSASAYWRQSTEDGIYAISGHLVRSGKDSAARFIGTQVELAVAWQATPELNLSASVGAFNPGTFIRQTGPAELIKLVGVMANYRF
ncbi:MAG TPA: alginate export family protein [Bosea sp. (in: a-proteobacteria)]|nr:alginate export family protein [Bosea sp. (in: a-proteobacteria)]